MIVQNVQLKERYSQQLDQVRILTTETLKSKFQKKKVSQINFFDQKSFHFILNSLLAGDIFEQDLLNQFWGYNFRQAATIGDITKCYVRGVTSLIQKIIQNNIRIYELTKQRQKNKQDHNFKQLNHINQQLQQLGHDVTQYISDLQQMCKPFELNFSNIYLKYKPYRNKQKAIFKQQDYILQKNEEINVFDQMEKQEIQRQPTTIQYEQLTTEEKYYRFFVYLTVIITLGDLGLVYSKFNCLDLLVNLLLLLNGLFEYYLFKDQQQPSNIQFLAINYDDNTIAFIDTLPLPFHLKTATKTSQSIRSHSFQRFTYSSFCILAVTVLHDLIWFILMNQGFLYMGGPHNPLILNPLMWRYNHFVTYSSLTLLIIKALMLIVLTRTVDFEWRKVQSRFNYLMNFLRFTNMTYINHLINRSYNP